MNKISDIIIGLGINMFLFVLWIYKMIVASDIPVSISSNTVINMIFLLVIVLMMYSIYIKNTRYLLINFFLLVPCLLLWFMTMKQALTYNYHQNDTLISIIGFCITTIVFIQIIYKKFKNKITL